VLHDGRTLIGDVTQSKDGYTFTKRGMSITLRSAEVEEWIKEAPAATTDASKQVVTSIEPEKADPAPVGPAPSGSPKSMREDPPSAPDQAKNAAGENSMPLPEMPSRVHFDAHRQHRVEPVKEMPSWEELANLNRFNAAIRAASSVGERNHDTEYLEKYLWLFVEQKDFRFDASGLTSATLSYADPFTVNKNTWRSDAAFSGMGEIASDTSILPDVSAKARQALGAVDDQRAVAELIRIVRSKAPDDFKTDAVANLANQMSQFGSLAAADFVGELAEANSPDVVSEKAENIIAEIGTVSFPGTALQPLTKSTSKLVREASGKRLVYLKSEEPRLIEADTAVLMRLKEKRVELIAKSVRETERELESKRKSLTEMQREPKNKDPRVQQSPFRYQVILKEEIVKIGTSGKDLKTKLDRLKGIKPLEFGVELLGEFDQITSSTSALTLAAKDLKNLDMLASRYPLLRYNWVRNSYGNDDIIDDAFVTIDVKVINNAEQVPEFGQNLPQRMERAQRLNAQFAEVVGLQDQLRAISMPGVMAMKRAYFEAKILKAASKKNAALALNAGRSMNLGDDNISAFFDVIHNLASSSKMSPEAKQIIECFSINPDLGYKFFDKPQLSLRTDAAFIGIGKLANSGTVPEDISSAARRALGRVNDPRSRTELFAIIRSGAIDAVKTDAVDALGNHVALGSVDAANELARLASTESNGVVKAGALRNLSVISNPSTPIAVVFALRKSSVPEVCEATLKALTTKNAVDDRLSDDDQLCIALARQWRARRIDAEIQRQKLAIQRYQAAAKDNGDRPSLGALFGLNQKPGTEIAMMRKELAKVEGEKRQVLSLKPLEFGAEMMEQTVIMAGALDRAQEYAADASKGVKGVDEFIRGMTFTSTQYVLVQQGDGSWQYEEQDSTDWAAVATSVIGPMIARNAEENAKRSANDAASVLAELRAQLAPLTEAGRSAVTEKYREKLIRESSAKKKGS